MSFEKTVKLACKPKNAPPKSKYMDPIIGATYSDDGSVQDICRALSLRLREPNAVVVFKALLVLHSMIRSGATDNVLSFLGQQDLLRLRNVVGQSWDGYAPPQNLGFYAQYLDSRIRGYRELRHDPVRVQAENNRMSRYDGRTAVRYDGASSKARKLKVLTVDKGLLREVKEVQKMVNAITLCKFYEDDLSDPCTVMAFRMLVKDLLVLVQAVNEGVVNLLEHYFEMAKTDAEEALGIYKAFCQQNDRVVEYLNAARRLHHIIDVPVPNLKHAPISLVKALEEYLNDPNFEQNRLEYKQNMGAADIPAAAGSAMTIAKPKSPAPVVKTEVPTPKPEPMLAAVQPPAQQTVNKSIQDFFDSIESEQPQQNYMDPYAQQMGMQQINPFRQSTMMMPQITGYPAQPFSGNAWAQQPNGRMVAQNTGFASQGFMPQQTGMPQTGMPQGSPFMQPQNTGFLQPNVAQQSSAFAQPMMPQPTGPNPFRQSMVPQSTGSPFPASPFPTTQNAMQPSGGNQVHIAKPLSVQPTGSKNPFALPSDHERKPSPQSTGPSLFQLSQMKSSTLPTGGNNNFDSMFGSGNTGGGFANEFGALTMDPGKTQHSTVGGKTGAMSDLASAFATGQDAKPQSSPFGNGMNAFGSGFSSSGMTSQATGMTSPPLTGAFGGSSTPTPMQPQPTGFAGSNIKPFKPSSNFGSTLVDNLPPLPASGTGTPVGNASSNTPFTASSGNAFGGATSPLAGQTTGVNPFSAQSTQNQGTGNAAFMNAFGTGQTATNGGNTFGQGQAQTTGNGAFMSAFGTNNSWMTAGR